MIELGRTIGAGALELADLIVSTGNAKISSAIRTRFFTIGARGIGAPRRAA